MTNFLFAFFVAKFSFVFAVVCLFFFLEAQRNFTRATLFFLTLAFSCITFLFAAVANDLLMQKIPNPSEVVEIGKFLIFLIHFLFWAGMVLMFGTLIIGLVQER